jgi:predicted O-linked N-acetylglucosamine transferase (SPINDLY family)
MSAPEIERLMSEAAAHERGGRLADAEAALRRVLEVAPDHPEAVGELGLVAYHGGDLQRALTLLRRATELAPDDWRAHLNLGLLLRRLEQDEEAVEPLRRTVALMPPPTPRELLTSLIEALRNAGRLTEASAECERVLAAEPNDPSLLMHYAATLKEQGRLDDAIETYARALQLRPVYPSAHSDLLLCCNYHDDIGPQELFNAHREFARRLEPPAPPPALPPPPRPSRREPSSDGRIRIGYLSPDLRQHSVAFFIWPVLEHHDRARFEVTCYSDAQQPDAVTEVLKKFPQRWRQTSGMSDDDLARAIAEDGIDLLVDLAGHTGRNRLPMLATRRVAPVTATWLGYPNTTGLSTIDYRITDAVCDPVGSPGADAVHSERLVRLPNTFFCYLTPIGLPDVVLPPLATSGRATFGVFTNFVKVRPPTIELWSRVLHATPGARLVLQAKALADAAVRDGVAAQFARHGIGADRLELRGWRDFADYLNEVARCDLILDTLPFAGHTTSCHAMWMGVPVVTLAGETHRGRMGASLLISMGLNELVATTTQQYVDTCTALTGDVRRLTEMRLGLRDRMRAAPFMNGRQFTRDLEAAYAKMLAEEPT